MQEFNTTPKIALVGTPNVGKSVIFNALTGAYVTVSNYPGTTVEVSRGKARLGKDQVEVIDTPGMYSFLPITAEENVTRQLLLREKPDLVVHVVDGKNLERMLPLTIQLREAGFNMILTINMMDEARHFGLEIDREALNQQLGIPVVLTTASLGEGLGELRTTLRDFISSEATAEALVQYDSSIETAISNIGSLLEHEYIMAKRSISLLLLQEDQDIHELIKDKEPRNHQKILGITREIKASFNEPLSYAISIQRQKRIKEIIASSVKQGESRPLSFTEHLSKWMMQPLTGIPILLFVVYVGLFKFVGEFGAGTIVDFIEGELFEERLNPWIDSMVLTYIPWPSLQQLLALDYGIFTMGIRYAVAIVLPIVGAFFLFFSLIEDSGYLPRLAMLVDRLFKKIGLSGRAVIPMTLGFGCGTMATMVTRTLETRRERIISTFLLALAVPCSAQLGLILALLAGTPLGLAIWAGTVALVFLLIGYLTAKLIPGEQPSFYMELPPLRMPKLSNVLYKTLARMQWYFVEIVPLFILASVLIWFGHLTGGFDKMISLLIPVVNWLNLPDSTAEVFLFGFFRRDYGAAGLYDLAQSGALTGLQLTVTAVTLTLFVPCIAHFIVAIKERGWKTAILMVLFIFPFAFLVGKVLSTLLITLGINF